jgi:hypothetical protein
MAEGMATTEADNITRARDSEDPSGSVCTYLVFNGKRVIIGNLGDCRAVLCRGGKAIDLTHDHTFKTYVSYFILSIISGLLMVYITIVKVKLLELVTMEVVCVVDY